MDESITSLGKMIETDSNILLSEIQSKKAEERDENIKIGQILNIITESQASEVPHDFEVY
jgi:hypothetical protein